MTSFLAQFWFFLFSTFFISMHKLISSFEFFFEHIFWYIFIFHFDICFFSFFWCCYFVRKMYKWNKLLNTLECTLRSIFYVFTFCCVFFCYSIITYNIRMKNMNKSIGNLNRGGGEWERKRGRDICNLPPLCVQNELALCAIEKYNLWELGICSAYIFNFIHRCNWNKLEM